MIRKQIYNLVDENNKENKLSNGFNLIIIGLILLNVVAIILESFDSLYNQYESEFYYFEVLSIVIFTVEYLFRLITADLKYQNKAKWKAFILYVFTPLALIDLFAILPFYLPLFFAVDLRFLRILRMLRVIRIFKLQRYSKSLQLIGEVFKEKRADLILTVFVTFILLIIASAIMYQVEHDAQPEAFPNIVAAFWWAIATLTTVGYGDVFPVTDLGKVISGIIAFMGIGLVALPTGILSAAFMDKMKKSKQESKTCPHCGEEIDNN